MTSYCNCTVTNFTKCNPLMMIESLSISRGQADNSLNQHYKLCCIRMKDITAVTCFFSFLTVTECHVRLLPQLDFDNINNLVYCVQHSLISFQLYHICNASIWLHF